MIKKHSADDDSESQKRTDVQSPEVCVDYLSYTFDEMDLAASWRVMTKQKAVIANGIRLENASWRTWAKQRNYLKTITPETLNWLKDSDVTWLYGPLHTVTKSEQKDRYSPKESSAHDKLGLIQASTSVSLNDIGITGTTSTPMTVTRAPSNVIPSTQSHTSYPQQQQRPLKSALKKVTMSDILRRSASEFHVSDLDRNSNDCDSSVESTFSLSEANRQLGVFSPAVVATHRQPKLRFNQRVEQYMVISDDDNSSANGSVPKVRMSTQLNTRYDNDDGAFSDSMADDDDDYHGRNNINDSSQAYLDDSNDDSDNMIMMYPHQLNRHDRQRKSKGSSSYLAPRSIRRIEPTVLKSSSYSDTSRQGSLSSWDDDHDRRSVHLPDYYATLDSNDNINDSNHSIQWEGQPCVVYDVAAPSSEVDSDFMDDDDWEIRQQSLDSGDTNDQIYDIEIDHNNDCIEADNDNNYKEMDNSSSNDFKSTNDDKTPMLLKNLPKQNPVTLAPPTSILSPGKPSKSLPISEPSPIDALQLHHHQQSACSNSIDTSSTTPSKSCHDRILDQQQQLQHHPPSSVFGNISQWASTYLRKS